MAGAYGVFGKFGIGSTSTVDQPLDLITDGVRVVSEIIDGNGIKGTRSRYASRAREGKKMVGGQISLQPVPKELVDLLPYIHGASPLSTSFPLGESLTSFYYSADRVTKVFTYAGCVISRATFASVPGQPLSLTCDLVGLTETVGNAGTFPSLTVETEAGPFMHQDLALTVNSVASVLCKGLTLTIDNAVDTDRFFNSQDMSATQATDRNITLDLLLPYGDQSAQYDLAPTGVEVVAVYTNGTVSLSWTLAAVQFTQQSPVINDRGEILLQLTGNCRRTVAAAELVTVLDSTV